MARLGYIKPTLNKGLFSPLTRPLVRNVYHSEIVDAVFPPNNENTRLQDAAQLLINPNVDSHIKDVIRNNVTLSLGDDNGIICDSLDDAQLVCFDPALQVGEEVDVCVDALNSFINESTNKSDNKNPNKNPNIL